MKLATGDQSFDSYINVDYISTRGKIRYLQELKTVIFLHWYLLLTCHSVSNEDKNDIMTLGPGNNVIKLFCPYFTNFRFKLVFDPGKLFQQSLTNTLAQYENMHFLVTAGSGPRPRTKRVKNDCTLSADYYNINQLNYFILYYY